VFDVQKIHDCPNDCILYQGKEYENLNACPVCEVLHYKIWIDEDPSAFEGNPQGEKTSSEGYVVFSYNTMLEAFVLEQASAKLIR
jgi:hypothetical protein